MLRTRLRTRLRSRTPSARHSALRSPIMVGLALALTTTTLWYYWPSDDAEQSAGVSAANKVATQHHAEPATGSQRNIAPADGAQQGPREIPGILPGEDGHEFDASIKQQLRTVAAAYQEQIRYPDFSVPIEIDALPFKYQAHAPVATGMPAQLDDPLSPQLSITATQVRYFNGEAPSAEAAISGLAIDNMSRVQAQLLVAGQVMSYADVLPDAATAHRYQLHFGPVYLHDLSWQQEAHIRVTFAFNGEEFTRSVPINFVSEVASVQHVSAAHVDGAFLTIPVAIATQKPGYHRLRANLYDRDSATPLVHLKAEQHLAGAHGELRLKAHIDALTEAGYEGPYELRDISLQRMPAAPDYITEYGSTADMAYPVEGFPFSDYDHTPYAHPKAQRIAKELLQLGS